MSDSNHELRQVCAAFDRGGIDRRDFMRQVLLLGASASLGGALAASPIGALRALAAAEDAEKRAWALAKDAAAKAKKKTITILHPTGAVGNMTPYVDLWKKEFGLDTEFIEEPDDAVHAKAMQEAVAKTGRYDVIMGTIMSIPDWAEAGLIHDLTDWTNAHGADLFDPNYGVVPPLAYYGQMHRGRVYMLFFDGDQWTLLMRSDYLNDPAEKEKFKAQFGCDLAAPKTWPEYDTMLKFFHRPDKKFYGGLEYRSRYYVKWAFMQRFASKGKLYFDGEMNAQFNSPEAVQTLEEMLALNPYLHPDAFNFTWSSNYNAFGRGEGFANFAWPSGFKYAKAAQTGPATTGKIATAVVPGQRRPDGSILHTPMQPFGWGFTISKFSAIPEVAYAYAQWITSPTRSADAIPYLGGYADPYRINHFKAPTQRLLDTYDAEFLKIAYDNITNTVPDFCLPGGFEYQDALDKEVHAAMTDSKKPKEAMEEATRVIDRITRRIGREKQKENWRALVKNLADPIKKASGADKWSA